VEGWIAACLFCEAVCIKAFVATQYEIPFKLSIATFQISMIAITPAMASHNARHPSCNFSVFMTQGSD